MERLKKSLDDADEQNRRINQEFQQILREKEVRSIIHGRAYSKGVEI